jgi:mono/diheme cytochrome c family protein
MVTAGASRGNPWAQHKEEPMTHRFAVAVLAAALVPAALAAPADGKVERGKYLVTMMGCHDCHTPLREGQSGPEPDMSRALSGHPETLVMPPPPALGHGPWLWAGAATMTAFSGPWGVSYAANLTPDKETGLGTWTEETFVKAIRTGKHLGVGRPILPPMPWPMYRNATDDDLKAMFAYLRTVTPIRNQVPQPADPVEAH